MWFPDEKQSTGSRLLEDLGGDADAPGGVLEVEDRVVDPVLLDELREEALSGSPARAADDVADEEQPRHRAYSIDRVSRITVTLISPG